MTKDGQLDPYKATEPGLLAQLDREEEAAQDFLDAIARGEDPAATEPPDEGDSDPRPKDWAKR